jgi:hypothetical protein
LTDRKKKPIRKAVLVFQRQAGSCHTTVGTRDGFMPKTLLLSLSVWGCWLATVCKGISTMRKILLLIVFGLIGCTDTGPLKIGPDSYIISARVPFGGPASASGDALREANHFCGSLRKEILLDHIQSSECALHGGCGEAQISFFCLAPDDSQLRRPKLQRDPNFKLEIDHKQL